MATAVSSARTIRVAAVASPAGVAGPGTVRLESRRRPEPGAGELLLRLSACGLCGTDLYKLGRSVDEGGAPAGAVLGHEVVGVVEEIGPGAVGFAPGDRLVVPHHVACGECPLCRRGSDTLCTVFRENLLLPGGFSDRLLVGERAVRRAAFGLPENLADEAAVFLEPAACVLRGIRKAALGEAVAAAGGGDTPAVAAVVGAGSMGLLHLLVLKALWPELRVAVSDPNGERRAIALRLGADAAAPPEDAGEAVAMLSGGLGADAVFDTAGGAAALAAALELGRPGGAAVLFAFDHSQQPPEDERSRRSQASQPSLQSPLDLNRFFRAERRLLATYSSGLAEQREIYRLLVTGRLDPSPLVTHRLPLSRLDEAVELARSRRALKVLLVPDPAEPPPAVGPT
jgi:L-iditol 2-dehydrogenase